MSQVHTRSATTVSRLTSNAPAAIAVLFLQGPNALSSLLQFWKPRFARPLALNEIRFGAWVSSVSKANHNDVASSEDIVVCQTESNGYEIHCHGGRFAAQRILDDLQSAGVAMNSEQIDNSIVRIDFATSKDNETSDRWNNDAWNALPFTTTRHTSLRMLAQARGVLSSAVRKIYDCLDQSQYDTAYQEVTALIACYGVGRHMLEPFRVVLAGPPNVGKSQLLNALLGYERSIVHHSAGTTRDLVREATSIGGWPVELIDSAGLRQAQDSVEAEGIQGAMKALSQADLVVLLVDPTEGWTKTHTEIATCFANKLLIVQSKADLTIKDQTSSAAFHSISVSALTQQGIPQLLDAICLALLTLASSPPTLQGTVEGERAFALPIDAPLPFLPSHLQELETIRSKIESARSLD